MLQMRRPSQGRPTSSRIVDWEARPRTRQFSCKFDARGPSAYHHHVQQAVAVQRVAACSTSEVKYRHQELI